LSDEQPMLWSPAKVLFNRDAINANESFNCIFVDKHGDRCKSIINAEIREEIDQLNNKHSRQPPDDVSKSGFECLYVLYVLCKRTKTVKDQDGRERKEPGGHLHTAGEETMAMLREKLEIYAGEWKALRHQESTSSKLDLLGKKLDPMLPIGAPQTPQQRTATAATAPAPDLDVFALKVAKRVRDLQRPTMVGVRTKADEAMALGRRTSRDFTWYKTTDARVAAMEKVMAERKRKRDVSGRRSVWSYAVCGRSVWDGCRGSADL